MGLYLHPDGLSWWHLNLLLFAHVHHRTTVRLRELAGLGYVEKVKYRANGFKWYLTDAGRIYIESYLKDVSMRIKRMKRLMRVKSLG